ncbi:MAG: tetratricopeptide repeat protein [Deltaproteobacteria bacterium]|nr:tetratricopeptide repeat protein [Deltaproteobacteria bacterium]
MRSPSAAVLLLAALGSAASADTFGGFSGVDRPYQVNSDRVCTPLIVENGKASGAPSCAKAAADVMAKLRFKEPLPQRGAAKATFGATASGRTLTVTSATAETALVTWDAADPITKIVEVYGSQYDDRVAVAYLTRRMGKEVTDVVAFDLQKAGARPPVGDPTTPPVTPPVTTAPPEDPKVAAAVTAARKAAKPKALAAWKAVLAADPEHSEARYQVAVLQVGAKQNADALATLSTLAKSTRGDAIEWLIEARFSPTFAALRSDPAFRSTVGLDKRGNSPYERLMGFGGQWEQTGTSCDEPEVRLTATRDRVVRIRVVSRCKGGGYDLPFKGTWRSEGDRVVITMPTKGKQVTAADEAGCKFEPQGDEDSLRCNLGRDIEFVVLPTRR